MKSSPLHPFLFTFVGPIPALKNGKEISTDVKVDWENRKIHRHTTVRTPKEVRIWYKNQTATLLSQRARQSDLDDIDIAYVRLELYSFQELTKVDGDNAYTTVQELLQPKSDREEGILDLIKDDKRVKGHSVDARLSHDFIGAYLWVWEYDIHMDDIEQLNIFSRIRQSFITERLRSNILTLSSEFYEDS